MDECEVRDMLFDILKSGNFPDASVGDRHIEKVWTFDPIDKNRVQFRIERHPHLFGKTSLGSASSAYAQESHLFEIDLRSKEVRFIDMTVNEPIINYEQLAEDVQDMVGSEYDDDLEVLKSEEEVKKFAEKKFEEFHWLHFMDYCEVGLPEDFSSRYLSEVKKLFISEMIREWRSLKDE